MTAERRELAATFALEAGCLDGLIERVDFTTGDHSASLDMRNGADLLPFDRHYSSAGHERLARAVLAWYRTRRP